MHLQLLQEPVYEARGLAAAPSFFIGFTTILTNFSPFLPHDPQFH